jgi:hypothetical protein
MNNERVINRALAIIAKYGVMCVWTKPAAADPDAPPWRDTREGMPTITNVPIAFFSPSDVGKGSELFRSVMAGAEVAGSTEVGIMAGGTPFEPELADTFVRNGERLNVVKFDRIAPAGVPLLYYVWIA